MARYVIAASVVLIVLATAWIGVTSWPSQQNATPVKSNVQTLADPIPAQPADAEDCNPAPAEDELAAHMAEMEAQQERLLRVLGVSSDAEHLMVAALASWLRPNNTALLLLREAGERDPRNPLVASQSLELCLQIDTCALPRPELERKLVAADGDNAMAWILIARSRLEQADEASALSAMKYAFSAAKVDNYFIDYVLAFERGFAAAADLPPYERGLAAIGHAAAMVSGALSITSDCQERAENLAEWRDACLRLGERLEADGRTLLWQSIGIRLQEQMYEYEGDSRAMQATAEKRARASEAWTTLASRTARAEELRDATVLRRYLETFQASGEIDAMHYLAAEIEARLPPPIVASSDACETP